MNLPLPNPELATSLGRRAFLRRSGVAAFTAAMAPMALGALFNATPAEAALFTDEAILNFALNLEYLEGEYYVNAVYGKSLAEYGVDITGTGATGATSVPNSGRVSFKSPIIEQFAREIADDEVAHIAFLKKTLGSAAIAKPEIDLQGAFTAIGVKTGLTTVTSTGFDPYASDGNFLLGAITLTDVGVTAYHGAAAFISSKAVLAAAGGILAAESYHDATLRTSLYAINYDDSTQFYGQAANRISDLRDSLDGGTDDDQGITNPDGSSNIVPTNGSSIVFGRLPRAVLNIVYAGINTPNGGFFPSGVNGTIV